MEGPHTWRSLVPILTLPLWLPFNRVLRYLKQPVMCLANACWEKLLSQLTLMNPVDMTMEKRCLSSQYWIMQEERRDLMCPSDSSYFLFICLFCFVFPLLIHLILVFHQVIYSELSLLEVLNFSPCLCLNPISYDLLHGLELKPFINAVHPIVHLWSRALASHLTGTLTSWIQNSFLSHPSSSQ